jgi:hypothetical protein
LGLEDIQRINFKALDGADIIVIHGLNGTDVTGINLDLTAATGGDDGQPVAVIIEGSMMTRASWPVKMPPSSRSLFWPPG